MLTTPNYLLKKIELTDSPPDITVINPNWDLIDAQLALGAPKASPAFTGTVTGITAAMVGLGSVNNTSDAAKPVSTAQQTALNLKANLASPTFTGTVGGITKAMVGLANVDNTSDALKPISTAQAAVNALMAPLASPTFTGTVSGITKAMVGLSAVDNTSDAGKPVSTAQQTALNLKANLASPTFTGTVSGITAAMVGLGNVNNTSDAAKPVSTAQQTALNLKANLASPTFTGTVAGITKAMVGLGSVDNTSDAAKPISTAQATVNDLKADKSVAQMHKFTADTGLPFAEASMNLNLKTVSKRWIIGVDTINKPFDYGVVDVIPRDTTNIVQIGYENFSDNVYRRETANGGTSWTVWKPINGIAESGSNATGRYIKFSDGTMLCYRLIINMGLYADIPLPAAYLDSEYTVITSPYYDNASDRGKGIVISTGRVHVSQIAVSVTPYSGNTLVGTVSLFIITIGRWK